MKGHGVGTAVLGTSVAMMVTIFIVDVSGYLDSPLYFLYPLVLLLIAREDKPRLVLIAAVACLAFAFIGCFRAFEAGSRHAALISLAGACITIGVTALSLMRRARPADAAGHRELQRLRADLDESRAELLNFMNSIHQILWRTTDVPKVDFYNRRFEEVTGRSSEEAMKNQDWLDDFHPDDQGWYLKAVDKAFSNGEELNVTIRFRYKGGHYRWVMLIGCPSFDANGKLERYYGGVTDIHAEVMAREELQRTREALEKSQAEVEYFANSVPYILWRGDADGRILYFNQRLKEVTGLDREEALVDFRYLDQVHPDDRSDLSFSIARAVTTNSVLDATVRVRHADGSYRWMRLYDEPIISAASGEVQRFGGASDVQVVMEMQAAVRELNESLEHRVEQRTAELLRTEARYASLFDVSNMMFAELDLGDAEPVLEELRKEGVTDLREYLQGDDRLRGELTSSIRLTRANGALAELLGFSDADEMSGLVAGRIFEDDEVLMRQLEMVFDGIQHLDGRTTLVGKREQRVPGYYTVNRLSDGLHIASLVDLSEQERISEMRRAAQEELARANRVATVGAFSASIAHELAQPIASLVMDAQTGRRWLNRDQPDIAAAAQVLERLSRTAERIANIVQWTRDNISAGPRSARPVELDQLTTETLKLLEPVIRRAGAVVDLVAGDVSPGVEADPVQLQQVIVNLVTNALDAMRDQEGERRVTISVREHSAAMLVAVDDNGPGIPDENLDKLFLPFFTTKTDGIGMGLQICRVAVESMGGTLSASNRPEGGARFSFTLPLAQEEAQSGGPATRDPFPSRG